MGTVNLKTASGGSVILSPANTASDVTITVPAANATMAVNGPAFSAYQSVAQTPPANTFTKVSFQTEEFDTDSNFDNVTNYRFTPTVAGYYQTNLSVGSSTSNYVLCAIYKNGGIFKASGQTGAAMYGGGASAVIYMNGSTDYIEAYVYVSSAVALSAVASRTYFQAAMVRSA